MKDDNRMGDITILDGGMGQELIRRAGEATALVSAACWMRPNWCVPYMTTLRGGR